MNGGVVFFTDVAGETLGSKGGKEVTEDVTGMLLADPMVNVHNRNPTIRLLELMILHIRRQVHIRTLRYRFRNKLRAAATAESNLGD